MRIRVAAILLLVVVSISALGSACGSGGTTADTKVSPTWITVEMRDVTIAIPTSELESGKMLHFKLATAQGQETFMAYNLDGETYVRASVCPPCRSISFSLEGKQLVCDTCGTRFDAESGNGISGACKGYPKARVDTTISGDSTIASVDDLSTAYDNTEMPGWP